MRNAGIDVGSRTVKLVVVEGGAVAHARVEDASFDPVEVCRGLLEGVAYDRLTATGYGRRLVSRHWEAAMMTEIKAVSRGARALAPACRTIIDIGGQDTKVVSLGDNGAMRKFAMNDRCAAGTGRFLEVMATALSLSYGEFAGAAIEARRAEKLSSMCTVFAESEVVSLLARGASRSAIALGIHQAIAARTVALLKTLPVEDDVLFAGGGALNPCLHREIEQRLGRKICVCETPQIVAALGCALPPAPATPG